MGFMPSNQTIKKENININVYNVGNTIVDAYELVITNNKYTTSDFVNKIINLQELNEFLGVIGWKDKVDLISNQRSDSRFKLVNRLLFYNNPIKGTITKKIPMKFRYKIKRKIFELNKKPSQAQNKIDSNLKNGLKLFYMEDTNKLKNLLKKNSISKIWV